MNHSKQALTLALNEIRRASNPTIPWTWDERYDVAMMALEPKLAAPIEASLAHYFSHKWDHQNHGSATGDLNLLIDSLAGIELGQSLYSSDLEEGLVAFAAFWPWAGNTNISVRIGVFTSDDHPEISHQETTSAIRNMFDIPS